MCCALLSSFFLNFIGVLANNASTIFHDDLISLSSPILRYFLQLTRWSFVKRHYASSCYSHPSFKRGNWELCKTMHHDHNKQQPGIPFTSQKYHDYSPSQLSLSSKKDEPLKMKCMPVDELVLSQVKPALPINQQTLPFYLEPLNARMISTNIIDDQDMTSHQRHCLAVLYPGLDSLASQREKIEDLSRQTNVGHCSSEITSTFVKNDNNLLHGIERALSRNRLNSNLRELLLSSCVPTGRNARATVNLHPSMLYVPATDHYSMNHTTDCPHPLQLRPNNRTSLSASLFSDEQNNLSENNFPTTSDMIIQRAYQILLNRPAL